MLPQIFLTTCKSHALTMEYQTNLLLVLLCSQVYHHVCVPSTTQYSPIDFSHAYKYGHYVRSCSSYYSNSCATFNYRLLLAGDIHTNPGPTLPDVQHFYPPTTNDNIANSISSTITYPRHQLFELNDKYTLSPRKTIC